MILGVYNFYDYYFKNHNNKIVCYNFKSQKRVKTKVINFIKKNHHEGDIIKFLKNYDLKLEKISTSKKYLMYEII